MLARSHAGDAEDAANDEEVSGSVPRLAAFPPSFSTNVCCGALAHHSPNVAYTLCYTFLDGACYSMWGMQLLPLYLATTTAHTSAIGVSATTCGLAQLAGALVAGYAADRYTRQVCIRAGALCAALALLTFLCAFSLSSAVLVFAGQALWGLYSGMASTSVEALFADSVWQGQRTSIYNAKWMLQTLCYVVGYAVAAVLFALWGDVWVLPRMRVVLLIGVLVHPVALVPLCWLKDAYAVQEEVVEEVTVVVGEGAGESAGAAAASANETCPCSNTPGADRRHGDGTASAASLRPRADSGKSTTMPVVVDEAGVCGGVDAQPPPCSYPTSAGSLQLLLGRSAHVADVAPSLLLLQDSNAHSALLLGGGGGGEETGEGADERPGAHESAAAAAAAAGRTRSSRPPATTSTVTDALLRNLQNSSGQNALRPPTRPLAPGADSGFGADACSSEDDGEPRLALTGRSNSAASRQSAVSARAAEAGLHAEKRWWRCCVRLCPSSGSIASVAMVPYWMCAVDFLLAIGSGMSVPFFTPFFAAEHHVSPAGLYGIFITSTLLTAATSSLLPWLIAVCGMGRITTVMGVRVIGTAALLALATAPAGSLRATRPATVTLFLCRNALMNSVFGVTRSVIMDCAAKHSRAKWSAFESVTSFSWAGSAALGGVLTEKYGYLLNFKVTVALQMAATLLMAPAALGARELDVSRGVTVAVRSTEQNTASGDESSP